MKKNNVLLAGLVILAISAAFLPGQSVSARIVGTVKDEEGASLAGVTVTAVNIAMNSEATGVSENGGAFRILGLTPGRYQVSFDLAGYQSYVAAGISLTAEQSITLRVQLKKTEIPTGLASEEASTASEAEEEQSELIGSYQQRGRFSLQLGFSMNYLAVGDTNSYLRALSDRAAGRVVETLAPLHGGNDFNAEIGYRITPRLEIALGFGLVKGHMRDNDLISYPNSYSRMVVDTHTTDLNIRAMPLQVICRYGLGHSNYCFFNVYGGVLYNFANWRLDKRYRQIVDWRIAPFGDDTHEIATGRGFGVLAGGRLEVVLEENLALTFDLSGRYMPLRNFSGQRESIDRSATSRVDRGQLWFFEYYDSDLGKWVRDLRIGDRPTGPETRNVSAARVDFSGLALRIGALFKF